ncbi:MAG: hypothetical protein QNJ70_19735 [Xenococcaceae cyanobacterium MO_207.B15]|nr:hypothetical protein [Xenococcaceae cyanobacterium MO_207.B15]MDJ0746201.1 hypothetical protein [Xenococcaceae cyanobacterium MO_167.B27]
MDTLQAQIQELQGKVERLHELVERISSQINTLTAEQKKGAEEDYRLSNVAASQSKITSSRAENPYSMTHKDILLDDNSSTTSSMSSSEQELSPDIQIRRLTAQLTAAYNRIAALEEQLLSSRIHF